MPTRFFFAPTKGSRDRQVSRAYRDHATSVSSAEFRHGFPGPVKPDGRDATTSSSVISCGSGFRSGASR